MYIYIVPVYLGKKFILINENNIFKTMENTEFTWKVSIPIWISGIMSIFAYFLTIRLIPGLKNMFIKANLFGSDMNKRNSDKM